MTTVPKFTGLGLRTASGSVPEPVSCRVSGESAALSVSVRVPLSVPVTLGVKSTSIVQLPPAAIENPTHVSDGSE